MNYILFEDSEVSNLNPFTLNHASFEIRCGVYSNLERVHNLLSSQDKLYLIVRKEIEDIIRERYPELIVNPKIIPAGLFLNASTIWNENLIKNFAVNKSYSSNNNLIAINRNISTELSDFNELLKNSIQVTLDVDAVHLNYLWDSIFIISDIILEDSKKISSSSNYNIDSTVIINNKNNVIINENVQINSGVILDASKGPIILDRNVVIDIGALIKGPAYIGENSKINLGAKLRGNISIGPVCKIGGELEDVIIQGYTNKQHDGYLGHSFLGEWINIGANTNNSDLKNNYSNIRINISKDLEINTLKQFLGVLIGDYTKTGISTMLNSGTFIGIGANIFGSEFQPKYINSFKWGKDSKTDFEKFIETCSKVKDRRNKKLSNIEISLLKDIYEICD